MRSSSSLSFTGASSGVGSSRTSRAGTPDHTKAGTGNGRTGGNQFDEVIDVMQALRHDRMDAFKDAFLAYDEPLEMDKFVECVMPFMPAHLSATPADEMRLVTSLCEFFSAVDINGACAAATLMRE